MSTACTSLDAVLNSPPRTSAAFVPGWEPQQPCSTCAGHEVLSTQHDVFACPCNWQASVVATNVRMLLARLGYRPALPAGDCLGIAGDWLPARPGAHVLTLFWRFTQDPHEAMLRRSTAQQWIADTAERVGDGERRHLVLIHRKRRAPVAELMAERAAALNWCIDFWEEDSFLFTPGVRGVFYRRYRVLTAAEVVRLEQLFQLDATQLPILFSADPAAKWWGVRPGDVVAIEATFLGGQQEHYRRCVYLPEEKFRKETIVAKKVEARDRHNRFLH